MSSTVLFLDTEFTDFKDIDLISIGITTECGQEFYREITDHVAYWRSQFVHDVVMPLTNMQQFGKSAARAGKDLADWINALPGTEIVVVVDYVPDWRLACKLLGTNIINKKIRSVMHEHYLGERQMALRSDDRIGTLFHMISIADNFQHEYYKLFDNRQHHALVDAKAMRYGFAKALAQYKAEITQTTPDPITREDRLRCGKFNS